MGVTPQLSTNTGTFSLKTSTECQSISWIGRQTRWSASPTWKDCSIMEVIAGQQIRQIWTILVRQQGLAMQLVPKEVASEVVAVTLRKWIDNSRSISSSRFTIRSMTRKMEARLKAQLQGRLQLKARNKVVKKLVKQMFRKVEVWWEVCQAWK